MSGWSLRGMAGRRRAQHESAEAHGCGEDQEYPDPAWTDVHGHKNGSGLFMSSAQMCKMLFDRFYQHCPKCGQKSRRLILSKKLIETKVVESSKRSWSRNGNWPVDEPMAIWLYSYQITHRCRICGHQWAEQVTKQRPW